VLEKAVERMLPKESPLARQQMTHLRLYTGASHPHEAQSPETIDFKSASPKNTRSV
ncbi:MAG: 50S ribosomal protein L13, partial [Caulobacter sp.]